MDEQLQPSISALRQLSPPSQELVVNLIRQLAERENIAVPLTPSAGLQTPADGMELWEADLTAQNWSRNTIKTYKTLLTTYLKEDPTPTPSRELVSASFTGLDVDITGVDGLRFTHRKEVDQCKHTV